MFRMIVRKIKQPTKGNPLYFTGHVNMLGCINDTCRRKGVRPFPGMKMYQNPSVLELEISPFSEFDLKLHQSQPWKSLPWTTPSSPKKSYIKSPSYSVPCCF